MDGNWAKNSNSSSGQHGRHSGRWAEYLEYYISELGQVRDKPELLLFVIEQLEKRVRPPEVHADPTGHAAQSGLAVWTKPWT
ncbi:MAG: hypothetical protein R3E96_09785 [Planctomycetota bacterium]